MDIDKYPSHVSYVLLYWTVLYVRKTTRVHSNIKIYFFVLLFQLKFTNKCLKLYYYY